MAKIPGYESNQRVTTERANAPLSPQAASAGGRALQEGANQLDQLADHFTNLRDYSETLKAKTTLSRRATEIRQAALTDPDLWNAPQKVEEQLRQAVEESSSTISSITARSRYTADAGLEMERHRASIDGDVRRRQLDAANATLLEGNDALITDFYAATSPKERALVKAQIQHNVDEAVRLGALSREAGYTYTTKTFQAMAVGQVKHDLTLDPEGAARELAKGSAGLYPDLSQADRDELAETARKMAKVRSEEAERQRKLVQDQTEADVAVKLSRNQITLGELEEMAIAGTISREFFQASETRLTKLADDPKIPHEDKAQRFAELLTQFSELDGVKFTQKGKLDKAAKRNDLAALQAFRQAVIEHAEYLTGEQTEFFLESTQQDFITATRKAGNGRAAGWNPLLNAARTLPIVALPEMALRFFAATRDPSTTPTKAAAAVRTIIDDAQQVHNPKRSRYAVGQTITNPNGLQGEVVGFDEQGNPILKWKR